MTDSSHPLYPTHDLLRSRSEREGQLGQRGLVIWLFGLSGSGKTTIANALDRRLAEAGRFSVVLDGDNLRQGLNRGLGFSDEDRLENIRRASEVGRLFAQSGIIVIAAFITPRRALRELARDVVGADDFLPVFLEASFETCARRDPKGLYARVAQGEVQQFTGRDSAFEGPAEGDLVLNTEADSLDRCVDRILAIVLPRTKP